MTKYGFICFILYISAERFGVLGSQEYSWPTSRFKLLTFHYIQLSNPLYMRMFKFPEKMIFEMPFLFCGVNSYFSTDWESDISFKQVATLLLLFYVAFQVLFYIFTKVWMLWLTYLSQRVSCASTSVSKEPILKQSVIHKTCLFSYSYLTCCRRNTKDPASALDHNPPHVLWFPHDFK